MSDIVERLEATKHGLYWDVARDAIAEITRLRTLLSEAEQRGKDARVKALEEAAKVAEVYQNECEQTAKGLRRLKDYARSKQVDCEAHASGTIAAVIRRAALERSEG